jgi:hypothetical protein
LKFLRLGLAFLRPSRVSRYDRRRSTPKEETMRKVLFVLACIAAFGLSPAQAAEDLCNDAHMKQMDEMIAKMTDPAKQKEAMAALDQSKAAMKAGNNAECMKYMDEAHKAMGL